MAVIVIGNETAMAFGTVPVHRVLCRMVRTRRMAQHTIPYHGEILTMAAHAREIGVTEHHYHPHRDRGPDREWGRPASAEGLFRTARGGG